MQIQHHQGALSTAMLADLLQLRQAMHPERTLMPEHVERINQHAHQQLSTHFIEQSGLWLGYKIGYEESSKAFFSWVGGVHPEHRRAGLATQLLLAQHDWCRSQGYQRITTLSNNAYKDMMRLNLKHGFDIIGTKTDGPRIQILFSKTL